MSVIDEPHTGLLLIDEAEQEQFAKDSLENVISELGGESVEDILLKVYLTNPLNKKDEFCFNASPEELPLEPRLISEYGSGDFVVRVMTPNENGRGKSLKRKLYIPIAKKLNDDLSFKVNEPKTENINELVTTMMRNMETQQSNMMQMFRESQLESQNKTQELMITILGNKNDGEKPPTLLETMTLLKGLQPEQKDPMKEILAMLTITEKIKESSQPEQKTEMGALVDGMTGLIDLAKNSPTSSTQAPMKPPHLNNQKPVENNAEPDKDMGLKQTMINREIGKQIQGLISKAESGKVPELYAELAISEIPEQYYPQLLALIGDNDDFAFEQLKALNPNVAGHDIWFKEFTKSIREFFIEMSEESDGDLTTDTSIGDDGGNEKLPLDDGQLNAGQSDTTIPNKSD